MQTSRSEGVEVVGAAATVEEDGGVAAVVFVVASPSGASEGVGAVVEDVASGDVVEVVDGVGGLRGVGAGGVGGGAVEARLTGGALWAMVVAMVPKQSLEKALC